VLLKCHDPQPSNKTNSIQYYYRLSNGKMMNHFIELKEKGMINCSSSGGLVSDNWRG
jgi:hypothetical protein